MTARSPRADWRWKKLSTARLALAEAGQEPCSLCGHPIDYSLDRRTKWGATIDHLDPIATGGDPYPPLTDLHPAHRFCQGHQGAAITNALQGLGPGSRGGDPTKWKPRKPRKAPQRPPTVGGSSSTEHTTKRSESPAHGLYSADLSLPPRPNPVQKTGTGFQVLEFGGFLKRTSESGDIPRHNSGFALPRLWTPASGDADYEMADAALTWAAADTSPVPAPSPWEAFVLRELLSCRPGHPKGLMLLRHSLGVLRCSRQQGKTVVGQIVATWMLRHGQEWLGDVPRIINTHTDGKQAVEMLKPVAERLGYGRANGGRKGLEGQVFMAVWHPWGKPGEFEPVWTARAMTVGAMTGQKGITTAIVDELQDVRPAVVKEALGGAMSAPHIRNRLKLFMGTGEKPGSEYLRRLKAQQFGQPRVLWAEWSVPPGTDHGDEGSWEWASPSWSDSRLEYLRDERRGMDADEFNRNYLLDDAVSRSVPGLVDAGMWASAAVDGLRMPTDRLVLAIGYDAVPATFSVVAAWVVDRPAGGDAPRIGMRLVGVFGSQGEAVAAAEGVRGQACRLWLSENLRGQVALPGVRETIAARDGEADQALALGVQRLEAGLLVHAAEDDGLTAAVLSLPRVRVRRRWETGKMALLAALVAARPAPRSGAA